MNQRRWIDIPPFSARKPEPWEIEHKIYYPLYEKARQLEIENRLHEALEIYVEILSRFTPRGTVYYERPAIILEKLSRFEEAISICDRAIDAINNKLFNADAEEFIKRRNRLEKKLEFGKKKEV